MRWRTWLADRRQRLVVLINDSSAPTPLSKDEKRALNVLNDAINTLVSYIVILSILSVAAPMIRHNMFGSIVLAGLILIATLLINAKIFIQLLPTTVARNPLLYVLACMSLLFISTAFFILFI